MKHYKELTRTSIFVDPEKWGEVAKIVKTDPKYDNAYSIIDEALESWLKQHGKKTEE